MQLIFLGFRDRLDKLSTMARCNLIPLTPRLDTKVIRKVLDTYTIRNEWEIEPIS